MRLAYLLFLGLLAIGQSFGQVKVSSVDLGDGIILTATIETFDKSKHKLDTCDSGHDWRYICLIDGKIWFGSDMGMDLPRNQLTKLIIRIKGQEIHLETAGMFDTNREIELREGQYHLTKTGEEYFLEAMFSDGAGAYIVNWKIVKNKSLRTKISNDEGDFD
jgi:hypothetical protein